MKRREFITLMGVAAVTLPFAARAEQHRNIYRIGMLENTSAVLNAANLEGFRQGIRELGYVEGQTFILEYRSVDGRAERYPDLAADLVRLRVDAIVTRGTPGVVAAKNACWSTTTTSSASSRSRATMLSPSRLRCQPTRTNSRCTSAMCRSGRKTRAGPYVRSRTRTCSNAMAGAYASTRRRISLRCCSAVMPRGPT